MRSHQEANDSVTIEQEQADQVRRTVGATLAARALEEVLPAIGKGYGPRDHQRVADAIVNAPYLWCSTSSPTPRKHAHPEPSFSPKMDVTVLDGGIVNAWWDSDGVRCTVSANLAMLRKMLEVGEAYMAKKQSA